jgi:hypothetical protein
MALSGMQNRTYFPDLAAINRILISVMDASSRQSGQLLQQVGSAAHKQPPSHALLACIQAQPPPPAGSLRRLPAAGAGSAGLARRSQPAQRHADRQTPHQAPAPAARTGRPPSALLRQRTDRPATCRACRGRGRAAAGALWMDRRASRRPPTWRCACRQAQRPTMAPAPGRSPAGR